MTKKEQPVNQEAIMYYVATVFKSDNNHVQIAKVMKVQDQFAWKREFIKLINKGLEEWDYLVGVQGNLLEINGEVDIIL